MNKENYLEIAQIAVKAIDSKRGDDIELIKVSDITVLTDYFVIATANSNTQLKAIADEVEYKLSEAGYEPHHIEGERSEWVCLDYAGNSYSSQATAWFLSNRASLGGRRKNQY